MFRVCLLTCTMGCGSSATAASKPQVPPDWLLVTVETETGDITVKAVDGTETKTKFNLERVPQKTPVKKFHFVEQKIGGTWDEAGGQVKFSCLTLAEADKVWKEKGSEGVASTASEGWVQKGSANSMGAPKKVNKDFAVNGKVEWKGKTFMLTGTLNETMHIAEKESGEVVMTLFQKMGGMDLKFYNRLIEKKGFRQSSTETEQEEMNNAFCGTRSTSAAHDSKNIVLHVKPEVLETIPVSLFAISSMYSSMELNDMDC